MHRKPDAQNTKRINSGTPLSFDSEMQAVQRSERLVVAGDLNGHVGSDNIGY